MQTTATKGELERALSVVNEKYEGNIEFRRFDQKGKWTRFTLKCKSSKGPGHRVHYLGEKGRKSPAACWHVHGDFFDALFKMNPGAIVKTGKKTITINEGNWEDWNIGSVIFPVYYSESCDCDR